MKISRLIRMFGRVNDVKTYRHGDVKFYTVGKRNEHL